tara:strand:+ start:7248 stop:7523 length:276 start_codon:yes stop_codon:yes gene_type:complete
MDTVTQYLQNPYVSATLTIFLVLYGALARPDLPDFVMDLFDNALFRMLVLFLIAYTASTNLQVAMLVAVGFTLTMNLLSERKMAEGFMAYQ